MTGTKQTKTKKRAPAPPPDENGEFFVDAIIGHRIRNNEMQLRVKWTGYEKPTWALFMDIHDNTLAAKYVHTMLRAILRR